MGNHTVRCRQLEKLADVRACCVRDECDVTKYVFYSAASGELKWYDA